MIKSNECAYCRYALSNNPANCPKCGSLLIRLTRERIHEGQLAFGIVLLFLAVVLFSELTGLSLVLFWIGGMLATGVINLNA